MTDHSIESLLTRYEQTYPGREPLPVHVVVRWPIIARAMQQRLDAIVQQGGMGGWEFEVLLQLRLTDGEAPRLTPKQLAQALLLTSGAMTNRLDSLEEKGWVRRRPHPSDRRSLVVELLSAGRDAIDRVLKDRYDAMVAMVSGLTPQELQAADQVTRKMLDVAASSQNGKPAAR